MLLLKCFSLALSEQFCISEWLPDCLASFVSHLEDLEDLVMLFSKAEKAVHGLSHHLLHKIKWTISQCSEEFEHMHALFCPSQ